MMKNGASASKNKICSICECLHSKLSSMYTVCIIYLNISMPFAAFNTPAWVIIVILYHVSLYEYQVAIYFLLTFSW